MKPQTEQIDVEAEAQALLDAAGPAALRAFHARYDEYPDEHERVTEPPPAPEPQSEPRTIQEAAERLRPATAEELSMGISYQSIGEPLVQNLCSKGEYTPEQVASLRNQVRDYFNSDALKDSLKRQLADEPFAALVAQLRALNAARENFHMDYNHGVDLKQLRAALTTDTTLRLPEIPFKGLGLKKIAPRIAGSLTVRKRILIGLLIDTLLQFAAFAKARKSPSERTWKQAYLLTLQSVGGPYVSQDELARPMRKAAAEKIVNLFTTAYYEFFADMVVDDEIRKRGGAQ